MYTICSGWRGGGERAEKTIYRSKVSKKCLKTPFLACFSTVCLWPKEIWKQQGLFSDQPWNEEKSLNFFHPLNLRNSFDSWNFFHLYSTTKIILRVACAKLFEGWVVGVGFEKLISTSSFEACLPKFYELCQSLQIDQIWPYFFDKNWVFENFSKILPQKIDFFSAAKNDFFSAVLPLVSIIYELMIFLLFFN